MTPLKQLNRHDPNSGVYGDCFRTCVASVLDLPPGEVPHVFDRHHDDGAEGHAEMNAWLAQRGLRLLWIAYQGDISAEKLLSILGEMNPKVPFLLSHQSAPGTGHFVVCMDGKVVCEPSLAPTGKLAPHDDGLWHIFFLGAVLSSDPQPLGSAREATEDGQHKTNPDPVIRHGRDSQGRER